MATNQWWASESFWRKTAMWVTGVSFIVLILLTFDTLPQIAAGSKRVPAYSAINYRIEYKFDETRHVQAPVLGVKEPLFGKELTEQEAEALVTKGKLTIQAKNCINCHTLLGNGAYYAPDLTKSWLDRYWGSKEIREGQITEFIKDPSNKLHNSIGRRMPKLGVTDEEARAVVAFLKWMSAIDTNGFPYNFKSIQQEE